ncbi:hypothetical protein JKF63_03055 [Porcisia hertigi]|uniref:Uncharacterized protein n=1 Tax=Porcisia hertigi TaxID=2761500 RepID=A0A836I5M1_9TRYP|nr:hypothetical protein JKF63_03055 [Porcisia hertigi]
MHAIGGGFGTSRRRRTPALLLAAGVLLLSVLAVICLPVNADMVATPLCAEVHGFAGEFHDHYSIPVERALAAGEAVILIARAFPLGLGSMMAQWLYLNATYKLMEGVQVTKTSDNNGLLELANVAAGTDIEVRVLRVRPDGPVPFRFFSFLANSQICHLGVTPSNQFFAPVPHRLAVAPNTPVNMYFKTVLPPNVNALIVRISVDGRSDQQFISADKVYTSGDLVPAGGGGIVLFSYAPPADNVSTPFRLTTVSVSYSDLEGSETKQPSTPSLPNGGSSGNGTVSPTPAPPPSSSSRFTSVLQRLLFISLVLFLVYQVVVSAYNYHVLGKRDLMDILPCAEFVAAGALMMRVAISRCMGVSQRHKEGYEPLQNLDNPYA